MTTTETAVGKPVPLAVKIIFGLFGFAASVLGFVFLAPYGIWWVGVLSCLVWMVPSLVFKKSLLAPWVSVAMILAVCDLQQGTFYLAAWIFGVAGMNTIVLPPLVLLLLLVKALLPKLEKWEAKLKEQEAAEAAQAAQRCRPGCPCSTPRR